MAAKAVPEPSDPAALKAQHAIIYSASTSELKDDIPQLVSALKSGHGPLSRQEAAFLIWYHALDGEDMQQELLSAGIVNVCMGLLDAQPTDVSAPEKTCAAGILASLCGEVELREAVARGRAATSSACTVLHSLMQEQRDSVQLYAARCLHLLSLDSSAKSILLRSMDNQLLYAPLYQGLLRHCRNSHVMGHLASYVAAVIDKRDDLRGSAVDSGLVEAVLEALAAHKTDSTIQSLLRLLLGLVEDRGAWGRLQAQGGIRLLVDLLGPPPKTIMDKEMEQHRALLDPAWAAAQAGAATRLAAEQAKEQADAQEAAEAAAAQEALRSPPRGSQLSAAPSFANKSLRLLSQKHKDVQELSQAAGDSMIPAVMTVHTPADATDDQPLVTTSLTSAVDKDTLLSINKSGLKWRSLSSLQTHCLAAGCLYLLAQHTEYMMEMSGRLAASRLAPLLLRVVDDGDGAGKKRAKKKSLALSPEQTQMLVHVTGCLKFLSLVSVNRFRVAAFGTVQVLTSLYRECAHTLLRRNAQVILSNISLLAENGQLLLEGGLPEEFLVPRPLRLSQQEVEQLKQEFPDAKLSGKQPAPALPGPINAAVGNTQPAGPGAIASVADPKLPTVCCAATASIPAAAQQHHPFAPAQRPQLLPKQEQAAAALAALLATAVLLGSASSQIPPDALALPEPQVCPDCALHGQLSEVRAKVRPAGPLTSNWPAAAALRWTLQLQCGRQAAS